MKKSEKIKILERSITYFREECIKLSVCIDALKVHTKKLTKQKDIAYKEVQSWRQEAKLLKYKNVLLKNTINQLKNPKLI